MSKIIAGPEKVKALCAFMLLETGWSRGVS